MRQQGFCSLRKALSNERGLFGSLRKSAAARSAFAQDYNLPLQTAGRLRFSAQGSCNWREACAQPGFAAAALLVFAQSAESANGW